MGRKNKELKKYELEKELKKHIHFDIYVGKPKGKATLRLYLNDPAIQRQLRDKRIPIPVVLRGEVSESIRLGSRLTKHIVFSHGRGRTGFSTVFFDLDRPPSLRERLGLIFLLWLEKILSKLKKFRG